MIRLSVMYPAPAGSQFNWDYYLNQHLEPSRRLLTPRGLVRLEIDKGVGSFPPGTPPPYHAIGHLFFHTMDDMIRALKQPVKSKIFHLYGNKQLKSAD